MAELLSMTLLSAEPASVSAKSPSVLSQDGTTQPDQSFAATLAAEVNGKAPEKPAKAQHKTRQNTASEQGEAKELSQAQSSATEQPKPQETKAPAGNDAEALQEDETLVNQATEPEQEETQAEQSHWLNLLEKAKSLHERLDKSTATVAKGKADDKLHQQQVPASGAGSTAELTAELNGKSGTEAKQATASADSADAAITAATKQQSDKIKAAEALLAEASATSGKSTKLEGSTGLTTQKTQHNEKAMLTDAQQQTGSAKTNSTEHSTEQQLTAQELKVLTQMAQTDKKSIPQTAVPVAVKQQQTPDLKPQSKEPQSKTQAAAVLPEQVSELASEQATPVPESANPEHRLLKEGGLLQGKIFASLEKSAEKPVKPVQLSAAELKELQSQTDQQKLTSEPVEQLVITPASVGVKAQLQAETLQSAQKNAVATNNPSGPTEKDKTQSGSSDTDNTEAKATVLTAAEPKLSVQAQSAAAVVAPVAQQTKASASEPKMTTEEALKQVQIATGATHSESNSSSSSGDPQHKQSAELAPIAADPQKLAAAPGSEAQSFASQLRSNLEKTTTSVSTVAQGRELQSEQKQMDQLGQKLNLIQPEASNQLKDKMLMMVKDKVHTAEIRLDPSELGSMQIKINLQQDQMSVQFMVQQGNAKELMEQQMPKLKELLQQQGIELSQGSVQQQNQSSSGQEGGRRTAAGHSFGAAGPGADESLDPALIPAKNSDRVVDYYA